MSISISTYPELYVIFAKSGVKYKIATSGAKTLGTAGSFTLVFTEFPVADDTIKLVWGENDLTFTFKNTPDASGLQLSSNPDLLENMVYYIRLNFLQNWIIYNNWTITQGTGANTHKLYFVAKTRGDFDITITYPVGTHCSTADKTDGTDDSYLENYKVMAAAYSAGVLLGGPDMFHAFHDDDSAAGEVEIDLGEYICNDITPLPTLMGSGDKIIARTDIVKDYTVQFAESYGDPAVVKALLSANSHTLKCIKGGIGLQRLAIINDASNDIYSFLAARKQFLTWLPKNLLVDANTQQSIFYLHTSTATTLVVKVKIYFQNGATWTGTSGSIAGCSKYACYEVNCNIYALVFGITPTAGTVASYDIWVEDAAANVLTEVRHFILDYNRLNPRYFKFFNSLGAWDVIRTTGNFQKSRKFEGQLAQATLPFTISGTDFHRKKINNQTTEVFGASTGYCNVNSPEFSQLSEMMAELFLSDQVYEITDNGLVPVIITSSEYLVSADDENMRAVAFDYEKTYVDNLISDIEGAGDNYGEGGSFGDGFGTGFVLYHPTGPVVIT